MEPESLDWKRKRRAIFIFYLLTWSSMGLEATMLSSSLLIYIKGTIKPDNPDLSYGMINAGRYVITLLFSVPYTRWFDRTRKLRFTSILIATMVTAGFTLYLLPFSIYLPLFGTILCGSNYIIRAVFNSQLFRIYDDADVPSCFAMATCAYGIGEITGPIVLMLSAHLEFWLGELHIVYGNFQALIMLFISTIRLIISVGFIHDIAEKSKCAKKVNDVESEMLLKNEHAENEVVRIDSYILIVLQFFTVAFGTSFFLCVPPYIIESLNYGKFGTTLFFLGGSSFTIITSIIARLLKMNYVGVYRAGLAGLTSLLISYFLMAILVLVKGIPEVVKYTFLLLLAFIYGFSYVGDVTFVPITLGHITHKSQQSSVEGKRMTSKLLGSFLGSFVTPYTFKYLTYVIPCYMTVIAMFIIIIVLRKKNLLAGNN